MKIDVPSCTVKSLRGATSLTVDGNEYEANSKGEIEIAQEHLTAARSHGFELVDGAEHDGRVEIKATGHNVDDPSAPVAEAGSNGELRQDGPTVEEFVAAGYPASKYPPAGYASKSTAEEIEAAIAAQEVDYSKSSKAELLELAAKREVKVETDANKAAIIKALEINDNLVARKYSDVLKDDLIAFAAKRGVEIDAKASKDDIIAALVKADGE